jgi:hypothetical protein
MPDHDSPPPRRAQFGLRALLLLTLMFSILAATLGGLLQGGTRRQVFVLFGVASPVLLMIALGACEFLKNLLAHRRKSK